jgi:hypothetical protein
MKLKFFHRLRPFLFLFFRKGLPKKIIKKKKYIIERLDEGQTIKGNYQDLQENELPHQLESTQRAICDAKFEGFSGNLRCHLDFDGARQPQVIGERDANSCLKKLVANVDFHLHVANRGPLRCHHIQ